MGRRVQLYGAGVIAADGTATVTPAAPIQVGEVWTLTSVTVSSTSALPTSANIYRGAAIAPNRMDVTQRLGNGATTDTRIELAAGEQLRVVWAGGTPGAAVSVTATGESNYG